MEFEATNNVTKYEALFLGITTSRDLGNKILEVIGGFDLSVCQVKGLHAWKNERLKRYGQAIPIAIEKFDILGLEVVPKAMTKKSDALVVSTTLFQPCAKVEKYGQIETIYTPSIPNNIKHW